MPTSLRSPPSDTNEMRGAESGSLSLLGGFAAALLLLLSLAYGVTTWSEVRADQINRLDTAIVLSEKALDRFFVESQAQLRELSFELEEGGGLEHLSVARRLLGRYATLHVDALAPISRARASAW